MTIAGCGQRELKFMFPCSQTAIRLPGGNEQWKNKEGLTASMRMLLAEKLGLLSNPQT